MASQSLSLIFNGQLVIFTVSLLSGSYPNRRFLVSQFVFNENLDNRSLINARDTDVLIDSVRNRFIFRGFNLVAPFGLFFDEDPWEDIRNDVVPSYSTPSLGTCFLFRKTPNCELYQHGRVALGISETIVEYMSQKTNYQIEEFLCGTGPTGSLNSIINFLGSTSAVAPLPGQTGGIPGDRPDPREGDEWVDPLTGDRYIYDGSIWEITPCCAPINIFGSTGAVAPVEGQTGGIPGDRPDPREGDEWVDPGSGERWIYQDGRWQLAPCCLLGLTALRGPAGLTGAQGDQGVQGDSGLVGLRGSQGERGETGPQGLTGDQGEQGDQGDQGFQGLTGLRGETGHRGETGDVGETGVEGATGDQGPQGAQGDPGLTGQTGALGDQGAQGEQGAQGDQGLQGATGAQGQAGAQGDMGVQGIAGVTGADGDQGSAGLQGATGAQGVEGETGDAGVDGVTGDAGEQGVQGPTGVQGLTGVCSPLFTLEGATSATGGVASGPVSVDCGDLVRVFSEGNLEIEVTPGSARVQVEPDNIFSEPGNPNTTRSDGPPDPTRSASYLDNVTGISYIWDTVNLFWVAVRGSFDLFRYGATGSFHDPANFKSAIVRSKVDNNIEVSRRAGTSTIFSALGYTYDITIPANDDIYHFTLVDESVPGEAELTGRFVFTWLDPAFDGNQNAETIVIPTVIYHRYGTNTDPNYTTNNAQVSPIVGGSSNFSAYTATGGVLTIDFQIEGGGGGWYSITLSF